MPSRHRGRIETKENINEPLTHQHVPKRVTTGIKTLDEALEGGVPRGTWVILSGEPGTGKTVLSLHFAYAGLQDGDTVIYVSTEQEFNDIFEQALTLGLDLRKHAWTTYNPDKLDQLKEKSGLIIVDLFGLWKKAIRLSQGEKEKGGKRRYAPLDIATLHSTIGDVFNTLGVDRHQHVRLIIDSISAFWVDKPALARKMSYELKLRLHRPNITAYLTSQYATTTGATFGFGVEHIADGVIHLWMDNVEKYKELRRYLIIKKMRMTDHAKHAFRLNIVKGKGVVLEPVVKK